MSLPVRAAGGIVLRGEGGDRSVALVHRPRYNDWSFPKGKLDATTITVIVEIGRAHV